VVTTVDTIFREEEFRRYIECFREVKCDGLFGVTDYIDDEKPLYVSTDNNLNIQGFYDECPDDCRFVSGGIYGLTPEAFGTLERCVTHGKARMRNFQRALVREGFHLRAFPFSKVLDIDHASDISKAEAFLQS
jgi:NDP-sugar pyrophosphorylase family protein